MRQDWRASADDTALCWVCLRCAKDAVCDAASQDKRTVVVGWDYGTYRTYGTYDYGTRGQEDCFAGDNGTMGQRHTPCFVTYGNLKG